MEARCKPELPSETTQEAPPHLLAERRRCVSRAAPRRRVGTRLGPRRRAAPGWRLCGGTSALTAPPRRGQGRGCRWRLSRGGQGNIGRPCSSLASCSALRSARATLRYPNGWLDRVAKTKASGRVSRGATLCLRWISTSSRGTSRVPADPSVLVGRSAGGPVIAAGRLPHQPRMHKGWLSRRGLLWIELRPPRQWLCLSSLTGRNGERPCRSSFSSPSGRPARSVGSACCCPARSAPGPGPVRSSYERRAALESTTLSSD